MLHALTKRLIERIHQMSMERRIAWSADDLGSQCSFAADGFSVELLQGQAGPSVHIRNADGVIIERATPTDLGEERNAEGVSYHAMVADAFVLARRSALGVDAALERILLSLDGASAEETAQADTETVDEAATAFEAETASDQTSFSGEQSATSSKESAIAADLSAPEELFEADMEIPEADAGPDVLDEEIEPSAPLDAAADAERDVAAAMPESAEQLVLEAPEAADQMPAPVPDELAALPSPSDTDPTPDTENTSAAETDALLESEASEAKSKPVGGAMALGAIFAAVGASALAASAPASDTNPPREAEPASEAPQHAAALAEAASDQFSEEPAIDPAPTNWAFPEANAVPTDMPASVDGYVPIDSALEPEATQAAAIAPEMEPAIATDEPSSSEPADPLVTEAAAPQNEAQIGNAIVDAPPEHAPAQEGMAEEPAAPAELLAIAPETETSAPAGDGENAPDAAIEMAASLENIELDAEANHAMEALVGAPTEPELEPAEHEDSAPPAPVDDNALEGETAEPSGAPLKPIIETATQVDLPASPEPMTMEHDSPASAGDEMSASTSEPQTSAASASAPKSTDPWWMGGKAEPGAAPSRSMPWWMTSAAGAGAASASAEPMADEPATALLPTETSSDPTAQDQKSSPPADELAEAEIDEKVGGEPAATAPIEAPAAPPAFALSEDEAAPTPPPASISSAAMPWWTARAGAEGQAAPWWMQKAAAPATMPGEATSQTILATAATDPSSMAEATQQSPPTAASGADTGSDIDALQDMAEPEKAAPDDQAASDAPATEPAADASTLERFNSTPAESLAPQMDKETPATDATASAEANEKEEAKPETPWWLRAAQKVTEPLFGGDKTEEAKDEPAPAASATAAEPEASGVEDAAPASSPIQSPPAEDSDDPYAVFRSSN